ncbi:MULTISPECIES: exonuclease SbcCD subunit D [Cohnella]|uniref:exonuclease SbcCD subunit D n=1 Tax=Cohnella TaxID=329857 RepID=UPI0009B96D55|nr:MULTISPECIES: exonuclease SbcCD subunit D [Cohnella]MBN2984970.1 exonuclease SbcCD subunit D [Cohnella algarum]
MKFIHTADWHLGKLVQGVYMTEDQRHALRQMVETVRSERPDAVVIAGDLYDRAVPPTEAVELLDELLRTLVLELETPVLAIAGNHDSPDRLNFGTRIMEERGLHLAGQLRPEQKPVVLRDADGEVHFHLVPFADPSVVRQRWGDESVRSCDDAMRAVVAGIEAKMDPKARHVLVGHAFVTPGGEARPNTSESERPLAIGGTEYVRSEHFKSFHYTALGHLHEAHYVANETIRYAGSPLKYSISEERHNKGFYIVELDGQGAVTVEKRKLAPLRNMRSVSAAIEDLMRHEPSDDYIFATLLNENPVLYPMEKVRTVYPNALHVERRRPAPAAADSADEGSAAGAGPARSKSDPVELFAAFYREVKGMPLAEDKKRLFAETLLEVAREEEGESA